jgi:hypothetical protein
MDQFDEIDVPNNREEFYFFEVFDRIPQSIISDEYYDKNSQLLVNISNSLFDINERTGNMPPELAVKVIEGVFSSILKTGIR